MPSLGLGIVSTELATLRQGAFRELWTVSQRLRFVDTQL